eukprot:TRINITY_DN4064_c0_g1_i1.p1 TRINITY_DN4064_c0_g1~~TRINITY_DN4064_c0_g1_i1.p1  ORF type:complete len:376 (+),score=67.25 TRINITY_DN4064_c0_g1_i1:643-1770(+)
MVIIVLELPVEERKKMLLLETEDAVWTKKMSPLLKTPEFFRNYSGLQIYEPIVKLVAPGLLNKEVLEWIVLNSDILTPDVIQRLATTAHFFSFERRGATVNNLVHLYLVSHACKFDLLGRKVVEAFVQKKDGTTPEDAIKNSPRLISNNSVVDLNEASMLFIERVHEHKQLIASKALVQTPKMCEELWSDVIGQLYSERDTTGDFSVVVNNHSYKAHKVILAFATSFFDLPNNNSDQIRIEKDISNNAWERLLKYFYTRNFTDLTDPVECLEILSIASYLKLDNTTDVLAAAQDSLLLRHCDTAVFSSINDDNALDRLIAAINREDPVDKRITMRYWVHNYERLFAKYETKLAALPKSIMFMLMSRVIQHETTTK